MESTNYEVFAHQGTPIKSWTRGVPFEEAAKQQLRNIASLPFIYKWLAVMPDVHLGKGATIGSVVPTLGAVIPAAVGVDIGCGMMAVKTSLDASQLPDNLQGLRTAIERAVPHGRSRHARGSRDRGAWGSLPDDVVQAWLPLSAQFDRLQEKHPLLKNTNNIHHLGTLGTGNHFIELAKKDMERWMIQLPDRDLAYLPEGTEHFDQYVEAVEWAQQFARINRQVMMARVIRALADVIDVPFDAQLEAVNCHHNYISREHHFGQNVLVTRKGAVRAGLGDMGIIPGSMGAKSFIVRGLGNEESFCSCSHGAGRVMSRTQAKKEVSIDDHIRATEGVECRKDAGVIDETPRAYKSIDKVMDAQKDLVEIVYTLKQVVCVKG